MNYDDISVFIHTFTGIIFVRNQDEQKLTETETRIKIERANEI